MDEYRFAGYFVLWVIFCQSLRLDQWLIDLENSHACLPVYGCGYAALMDLIL
jgi:hypothetical protein